MTRAVDPLRLEERRERVARRITVLVPAHNEAGTIVGTVKSLQRQTYPVHRIVVGADNCTDDTARLARDAGAEVFVTQSNADKKAGVVNQGFAMLLPELDDHDVIMTMDADGELVEDCVELALAMLEDDHTLAGVSGSVLTRHADNWVEVAQQIEYERGRRMMARKHGHIHVLSGAAAFFRVKALRQVAATRGRLLPGAPGDYMIRGSLVEDYELTLAVQELGWKVRSSKHVKCVTDLMGSAGELEQQRNRWYRGTLETLWLYGWKPYTRRTFIGLGWNLVVFLLFPLALIALTFGYVAFGAFPSLLFFALAPLFIAENAIVARRIGGWRPMAMALSFFPLWLYDITQFSIYYRALWHAVTKRESSWTIKHEVYA